MRGPWTRAWGRRDTMVPGPWRRRRPEELQVPGDAVSPPGAWALGTGWRSPWAGPLGFVSPRGPAREEI